MKLDNTRGIQQSEISGCKEGHKSLITVLFDKSHLRKCVLPDVKEILSLAVLVALGLWLSSIDIISEFVLAGRVPRNQAERDSVMMLIYFSYESHLHELQMIKWHTVAISLFRVWQELFSWCYEDENLFISTCEIYLFPFSSISCSFINPGKEHVSLKQTKYLDMWVAPDSLQMPTEAFIMQYHCLDVVKAESFMDSCCPPFGCQCSSL